MKKILITGSEGFVGKNLIRELNLNGNYKVYGVDIKNSSQNYKIWKTSIDKFLRLKVSIKFDYVVHLAANSNPYEIKQENLINDNLFCSINLFEKFKNTKTKFLFASSEWVYQEEKVKKKNLPFNEKTKIDINTLNPYSLTKYLFELYAIKNKQYYKNVIMMRFGIIIGKKENNNSAVEMIFNKIKNNELIEIGSLKNARNYLSVSDLIKNIQNLLHYNKSDTFNLTGSRNLNFKKIIQDIKKKINSKSKVIEKNKKSVSIRITKNDKIKKAIKFSEKSYLQDLF